jgi:transposase
MRSKPQSAAVYGIDLGKNVFHVVGLDGSGNAIQKVTLRRGTLLRAASQEILGQTTRKGAHVLLGRAHAEPGLLT